MGDAVVVELSVGNPAVIAATLGAPDEDALASAVTHCTRAFVEGNATFQAHPAKPAEYDGEIADGALTVWLACRSREGGSVSATRGYVEDPESFRRITGISIGDDLGSEHAFVAFVKP
jgi:hypothetical protein